MVLTLGVLEGLERKTTLPSVLVAVMGPYPMEQDGVSTSDLLQRMVNNTSDYEVNMTVLPDMIAPEIKVQSGEEDKTTVNLGVGIGMMRNWAIFQADQLGYDSVFLVENDAAMKPDTLNRLLECPADIVIPHQYYPAWPPIYNVNWLPYFPMGATGYLDIEWCVFTALLIKRTAFTNVQPFFIDAAGEGPEYERWAEAGLSVQMDLDTTIDVLRIPRGHLGYTAVDFEPHQKEIEADVWETCYGKMVQVAKNRISDIYLCSNEKDCGKVFIFRVPRPTE